MSALVVDDDQGLLSSVANLASTAQLSLQTASTWDDGLIAFQAISPTLVIADYNMPGSRHGLQLLFEMARLRPSVRFVMMSAFLQEGDLAAVEAFDFIDAVFRKTDPVGTPKAILDELLRNKERIEFGTDWVQLATAARSTREVRSQDLDTLDTVLRNQLPDSGAQL